jgi:hypothetical protein
MTDTAGFRNKVITTGRSINVDKHGTALSDLVDCYNSTLSSLLNMHQS